MRIMQVIPEFVVAGAENMCVNLTMELLSLGHEVMVVSLYDYHSELTERLEREHVRIMYLNKKLGMDFRVIYRIRKQLIQFKPDIIHTHLNTLKYVVAANIGLKGRIVHTIHSVAHRVSGNTEKILNKFFFHHCGVTPVALTEAIKRSVEEFYKLDGDKVPYVPNGIPLQKCKVKESYEFGKTIKIVHVGRFHRVKNHRLMVEAICKIYENFPNVTLVFVGEGELMREIEDYIKSLGAESYILEFGPSNDVLSILHDSDIFLLPSQFEGMPMTLIEAMGTGLPIVASNVGGIPDLIVNGENGLLCEPNLLSIVSCLTRIINDKRLREKIGRSALRSSENFSSAIMAQEYLKLYRQRAIL